MDEMMDNGALTLPEVAIVGKKPVSPIGVEVSKMGILGEMGKDSAMRQAVLRMLKTLEGDSAMADTSMSYE